MQDPWCASGWQTLDWGVKFTDDSLQMPVPISMAEDAEKMQQDSAMPAIRKSDQFRIHFSKRFGFIWMSKPVRHKSSRP